MMKTRYMQIVLPALALSLGFTAASAHDAHRDATSRFERIDADGDGQLGRAELEQHRQVRLEARFKQLDKNTDGLISMDELPEHRRTQIERMSLQMEELRGDGMSLEEFIRIGGQGDVQQRITRMDKDDDGMVSRDELHAGKHGKGGKRCGRKNSKQSSKHSHRRDGV